MKKPPAIPVIHKFVSNSEQNGAGWMPYSKSMTEPNIVSIQTAIAERCGVSLLDVLGADRRRHVDKTRQLAMWAARRITGRSYPDLGRAFASRHHTTVLHAVRQVDARRSADPALAAELDALCRALVPMEVRAG